jgi:D-amino-acid dehydrogenase
MRIAVLGAGVVGVTTAWYLRQAGHAVELIDRQPAVAQETSFANGGQISVSHSEPWANPGAPALALRWLGREDAPLLFRLRADPAQWLWGLRFLYQCLPWRSRANTAQAFRLALYSRQQLQQLRASAGLDYDHSTRGILYLYADAAGMAHGQARAQWLQQQGFAAQVLTTEQCQVLEPALNAGPGASPVVRWLGGIHAPSDEGGDACKFTTALAARAVADGVQLRLQTSVERIEVERGRVARVMVRSLAEESPAQQAALQAPVQVPLQELRADAYVLALGSYSTRLLAALGLQLPVYPVKGYSLTIALDPASPADHAPLGSISDEAHKLVFTRLGRRLRVAGTAELNGYDTRINAVRCEALLQRTRALFPQMVFPQGGLEALQPWTGLRPMTPAGLPCIGPTRLGNFFLNTGHGTLGWTMACGSAALLADLISGRPPAIDAAGLLPHSVQRSGTR